MEIVNNITYNNITGYPSIDKTHLEGTKFFERHPIVPSISLSNLMDLISILHGNNPAIDCLDLKATHNELKDDAVVLSKSFKELGVKKGDIIAIAAPNLYQSLVCFKAANRIGATTTFLNPLESFEETKNYLNLYSSPLLINYGKDEEYNNKIIKNTKVRNVITIDPTQVNNRQFNDKQDSIVGNKDSISYHDLGSVSKYYDNKFINTLYGGKQDALILYTSGSTGQPKSLLFTNENLIAASIYYRSSAHLKPLCDENRRWMGVVPFMYPYGFCASVIAPLLACREIILAPTLSPKNIPYYYAKNPYLIFGSPAFLELTKKNLPENQDLSSLKEFVSGGDFLSVNQSFEAKSFFKNHNADVSMCNSSGNGELLGCCTNAMGVDYRPETVGKLVVGPNTLVINPDTGKEVKYGENGILCVSGKHVFKNYYNCPEKREEVMFNYNGKQYYMTGNYGSLDKDGYFTMIGRASRFFITYTLNKVYCELIQSVVSNIDIVDRVAIVPKPDKETLFKSKAYVVLKNDIKECKEAEEYIIEQCHKPFIDPNTGVENMLKDYEIPQSITFLDILPRTNADKVDYELLKNLAQVEYNNEQSYNNDLILKK